MQLRAEQLHGHLAKSLAPVYAVHGDEPLLALEAADAVRAAARRQGFSERVVLEPGRGFDWSEFTHAAASLSLFAEKKLVELRLAARVEGNLLAAHQEVQKLALLAPEGELSIQTVNEAVASVARYDPYVAAEALLADGPARYVRVIEGLRAEGEQPTFVLFVLSSVLFVLHGLARGERADPLFVQHRLFNKPLQRAVQAAARRYPAPLLASAIAQAAAIDRAIKGVGSGAPWEEFIALGLKLGNYHLDIARS